MATWTYGSEVPSGSGGLIAAVDENSPAARAGVVPGERIVAADGEAVHDVLEWLWIADGASVTVTLSRSGDNAAATRELTLTREPGEGWGIEFADAIFDRVRTCRNNCAFCFMSQLPEGLRPALYLRDDDYRLSFLSGTFITLTNLTDADVDRIAEQALSPLYVSLHAVDPDIRRRLVCAHEDRALERFDELLDAGIDLHVQIVLVPGVNDGAELEKTLGWLAEREGVESVGIVPLGYTRYQEAFTRGFEHAGDAAVVIEQVQRWQFAFFERDRKSWVHLADEFYINARAPFPAADWYDGFPQYENGIGIVRTFVDEIVAMRSTIEKALEDLPEGETITLVTGMLSATTIAGALNACDAAGKVRLLVVPNRFFGGNVSVTGLLTGADIAEAIKQDAHAGEYVLPDVIFNVDGLTLDDMDLATLSREAGTEIAVVSSNAAGLVRALLGKARRDVPPVK